MRLRYACLALIGMLLAPVSWGADARPAVLFVGDIHWKYVARPLTAMGIEVDTCAATNLEARLASGKYNVVVPYVQTDSTIMAQLEGFMAKGGGVLMNMPIGHISHIKLWQPDPEWAAKYGATLRWQSLEDTNTSNTATDMLGCTFSWSSDIRPPVNQDAQQVLTLLARSGFWPPMAFEFGADWTVAVRLAPSVRGIEPIDHPPRLAAYETKDAISSRTGLLGLREVGKGRLAACGIPARWSFNAEDSCPTIEMMLTTGAGGKPSHWLRVLANTCRWLAEPSLKAGMGGAVTPEKLIASPNPKLQDVPVLAWEKDDMGPNWPPMHDQSQLPGLIGARTALSGGQGTVADYAKAARAAGLSYLVFLEDSLKMDGAKFKTLIDECQAASDDSFAAIPGLLFEDAQGDHFYTFGDHTVMPPESAVLRDGRLATIEVSRAEAMFKYLVEGMRLRNVIGYWRHKENFLPIPDYKLYNSFPIYSAVNGEAVDSAFDDYLYLMGWQGCHGVLALEIMTSPDKVAQRAATGWRVVGSIPDKFSDGTYTAMSLSPGVKGLREKWMGSLGWWSPYQYITQGAEGPKILGWNSQNNCVLPFGDHWRPDLWQYRARLHVASEAGLKTVTLYDGDRGIYRRWLPGGAKDFEHTLILANCEQRDLTLVVEDVQGRRAIGMEVWNRNRRNLESICGDRCNFLGNSLGRRPDGSAIWTANGFRDGTAGITPNKGGMKDSLWQEPANLMTPGAPTLPIDGRPSGFPSARLEIFADVPGEHKEVFCWTSTYLVGPEVGIGQAFYRLAYDPSEYGAKTTPLGHPYKDPEKQMQVGKNPWTSWYKTVPTKVLDGWARVHGWPALDRVRIGAFDAHLVMKQDVALPAGEGFSVMFSSGIWQVFVDGKPLAQPEKGILTGAFKRGVFAVQFSPGGSAVVYGMGDSIQYRGDGKSLRLAYVPPAGNLKKGDVADVRFGWLGCDGTLPREQVLAAIRELGIPALGEVGYKADVKTGRTLEQYVTWRAEAKDGRFEARLPATTLMTYIPLIVEGLNDNWSVFLLDRARPAATGFRALPQREGRTYAQIETFAAADLFVGHPVLGDQKPAKILVSWKQPGQWFVEAHNPTDAAMTVNLSTAPGWTPFRFAEKVELAAGASRVWTVAEKADAR